MKTKEVNLTNGLDTARFNIDFCLGWAEVLLNGKFFRAVPARLVAYQADCMRWLSSQTKGMQWRLA